MHRIEPPMAPLKNDFIIENFVVLGQNLFLLMMSLMKLMTSSTENQKLWKSVW